MHRWRGAAGLGPGEVAPAVRRAAWGSPARATRQPAALGPFSSHGTVRTQRLGGIE